MKTEAALGLSVVPVFAYQSLKKKEEEKKILLFLILFSVLSAVPTLFGTWVPQLLMVFREGLAHECQFM